ncbi:hypothetical protein C8Q75DRAFT_390562 [Abortiporus biennis]|nr:hypothetical protein C8Q75DRAFT_390562 [Abortiporus biennis]
MKTPSEKLQILLDNLVKSPHLRGLTHSLTFSPDGTNGFSTLHPSNESDFEQTSTASDLMLIPKVYHSLIFRGASLFPRLRTLKLDNIPCLHPSLMRISPPFRGVIELALTPSSSMPLLDLRLLITHCFPNVEDLSLLMDAYYLLHQQFMVIPDIGSNNRSQSLHHHRRGVALKSLCLKTPPFNSRYSHLLAKWLQTTPTLSSIRSFQATPALVDHWFLITSLGQTIRELRICWWYVSPDDDTIISFQSHIFPHLEALQVTVKNVQEVEQFLRRDPIQRHFFFSIHSSD